MSTALSPRSIWSFLSWAQPSLSYTMTGQAGLGKVQGRSQGGVQQTDTGAQGLQTLGLWGQNPSNPVSTNLLVPSVTIPTQWQASQNSSAGPLTLASQTQTQLNPGSRGATKAEQTVLATPQANAVHQWVANRLTPEENGTAANQTQQTLQLEQPNGNQLSFGKQHNVLVQGKPVVKTPSGVQWQSSTFRLVQGNQTGYNLDYNQRNSQGDATNVTSRSIKEGETWVQNTDGTRVNGNQVDTLTGLGAYQPTTESTPTQNNKGVGDWFAGLGRTLWGWIQTGTL
jgi:hypothetical protein